MLRIALVVGVVAVLAASRAEACSCSSQGFAFSGEGVPRNASLPWLGRFVMADAARLFDSDAQEVPVRVEPVPGGVFVVPVAPLAANAAYYLQNDRWGFSFTTGADDDLTPPAAPTLTSFTVHRSPLLFRDGCDLGGEAFFIAVERGSPPEAFEILEVFTGPRIDAIDTSAPALVVSQQEARVALADNSACGVSFPVSTLADLAVQVRSRDAAGNVSELSNAVQLKGGGCSAGGSALGLGWAVLAFVRARRRRA
jgi:hypothetical protein